MERLYGEFLDKGRLWRTAQQGLSANNAYIVPPTERRARTLPILGNKTPREMGPARTLMTTAKIFQTGRSQAVRLPKEFRFKDKEVIVRHVGNGVLLLPIDKPWDFLEAALEEFEPGFCLEREQPALERRETLGEV
jgi:antitoxin VapB